jgi:hypothetical protein
VDKKIKWFLYIVIFTLEAICGYYVYHVKGFVFGDAISRTANAFYVLYIDPPHLASIGTVWNPLPSLLQIPLMLLWSIYKPIASSALTGVLMSSAFAAGNVVLIYKSAIDFGRSKLTGIMLALLFCFNPFMFIYGFSGMTEVPFAFMIIWLITNYTQWLEKDESAYIIQMALALALAFLIRYEILPIAACLFLAVALITMKVQRENLDPELRTSFKYSLGRVEGNSILLFAPIMYTILVWILYNWIVTGNPFYFMNSIYSVAGFTRSYAINTTLNRLVGNLGNVFRYAFKCTEFFILPLVVIILYRVLKLKVFKWDLLTLLLLIGATLILQLYLLYKGSSAGALRYFIYPLTIIIAWFPYEMKQVNSKLFTLLGVVILIVADVGLGSVWFEKQAFVGIQEEVTDLQFKKPPIEETQREVARYINHKLPNARILMDSFRTYTVILTVNRPRNLVVSCSYQFEKAILNPQLFKIDYVIVPSPLNDVNTQDALNRQYPDLYGNGASWCTLVQEFNGYYRLYRVHEPAKKYHLTKLGVCK